MMPYKPYAPAAADRSHAYKYAWVSGACSAAIIPLYLAGLDGIIYGWIFGGAVGGVLASTLTGRTDDYFRSLCSVGHRWAMFALACYMLAGWLVWTINLSVPGGRSLLLVTPAHEPGGTWELIFDGHLAAMILAVIFHAGYGFQWTRDQLGASDET